MSDLERDLRDVLRSRGDAATPTAGDWQDLTVRMAKRNRRARRAIAGALAVVLIVGPLAGFAVARTIDDPAPSGEVTAGGPTDGTTTGGITTGESSATKAAGAPLLGGENLERLFRRTTKDGIAIRGFTTRIGGSQCDGSGWCPAPDCFPDSMITGELSSEAAVGNAGGSHFSSTATAVAVTGAGVFGVNGEDAPARWTIAQASDAVARVRVSYEGGGADEMAPVNGVVILAARSDVSKQGGTIEALDSSGSVIGRFDAGFQQGYVSLGAGTIQLKQSATRSVVIAGSSSSTSSSSSSSSASTTTAPPSTPTTTIGPASGPGPTNSLQTSTGAGHAIEPVGPSTRADCIAPPPGLPAPGEQPADPAAAKAAVEHAFALAYEGGLGDDPEKGAVVQDSESLADAMKALHSGSFAQQVKDASAKVTEIVFTSPSEAAVRYDIDVANYTDFKDRIGKALLIDGTWKVARVTACADIALAGATCPAK